MGVQLIDGDDEHCLGLVLMSKYGNSVPIRKAPPDRFSQSCCWDCPTPRLQRRGIKRDPTISRQALQSLPTPMKEGEAKTRVDKGTTTMAAHRADRTFHN